MRWETIKIKQEVTHTETQTKTHKLDTGTGPQTNQHERKGKPGRTQKDQTDTGI